MCLLKQIKQIWQLQQADGWCLPVCAVVCLRWLLRALHCTALLQEAEGLVGELSQVVQQQRLRLRGLAQERAEACARLQAMNPQVGGQGVWGWVNGPPAMLLQHQPTA